MIKLGKIVMLISGAAAVGACGYGVGVYNQHKQASNSTKVSLSSKPSNQGSKHLLASQSSQNSKNSLVNSSSQSSIKSSTIDQDNGQLYDSRNNTFAGYHNIHELWNSGYTVTSYLIDKCGYTPDQAHTYIRQHFNEIRPFLGSGEIQTYYNDQNSNNNNNDNASNSALSMDQDANDD